MKLLLHVCCAPCAIYPVSEAKKDNFSVTGFFFNPNIHPPSEYIRRREAAQAYFKSEGLNLVISEYDSSDFFRNVNKPPSEPGRFGRRFEEGLTRCAACWKMRLEETLSFAEKGRFDAFSTTLLGSPYQNHEVLKDICERLSKENKIDFYYKDFRIGFRAAHNLAGEKGMYCQNYCGCVFSMIEREKTKL